MQRAVARIGAPRRRARRARDAARARLGGGRRPVIARPDRALPRPAAGGRRRRRSCRSARAARRWCRCRGCRERLGLRVLAKLEGMNPTASFKDRGMTMAVSKAVEEGAERGHLRLDRQHLGLGGGLRGPGRPDGGGRDPRGQDRGGQAGPGAGARRARAGARGRLRRRPVGGAARWSSATRSRSSTRSTSTASTASARPPSRSATTSATRPTPSASRWATRATSAPTGSASRPTARPSARAACRASTASRRPARRRWWRAPRWRGPRPSPRRSASATPARGEQALAAMRESGGGVAAVTDSEILEAYRLLAAEEGVFCEPASAASVAGLMPAGRGRRPRRGRDRGLRADRPRAEGPRHGDRQLGGRAAAAGRPRGGRGGGLWLSSRRSPSARRPPRPTSARASTAWPSALDLGNAVVITRRPGPLEVRVTGEGAGELAEDASNLVCRALASGLGLARRPGRGVPQPHPARARPGLVVGRRRAPASWPRTPSAACAGRPDELLARATELEGHADNAAACIAGGIVAVRPGPACAPGAGARGAGLRRRHPRGAHLHRRGPPGAPGGGAAGRRRGHAGQRRRPRRSRWPRAAWTTCPPLLEDRLHEPHRAAGGPGDRDAARARRAGAGCLGATISGSGPDGAALVPARRRRRPGRRGRAGPARRPGSPGGRGPRGSSAAGVRARWTGGADLRLARAVG